MTAMATLKTMGSLILGLAALGFVGYLRFLSMRSWAERRVHKSGIQGLFKNID
jgi:hypothetical protein